MKRFLVILFAAAFVMAAGSAFGTPPGTEVEAWEWDDVLQEWVLAVDGRLFTEITPGEILEGDCNKQSWQFAVLITASIAQWIDWHVTWNEWHWYIRKPGKYGGNCIQACIASNGDIKIAFAGFDNLVSPDAVNPEIPVMYAHDMMAGGGVMNPLFNPLAVWSTPAELNQFGILLPDSEDLHNQLCWKLYNQIDVVECNTACEYTNEATITLTLENQKDWIDFATGGWWD